VVGAGSAAPSASGGPVHICIFKVCWSVLRSIEVGAVVGVW